MMQTFINVNKSVHINKIKTVTFLKISASDHINNYLYRIIIYIFIGNKVKSFHQLGTNIHLTNNTFPYYQRI